MTIHHDKLSYGKLASNMEELTEDKLSEMLKLLNSEGDTENEQDLKAEKNNKNNIKK